MPKTKIKDTSLMILVNCKMCPFLHLTITALLPHKMIFRLAE